ncbi:MAG: ATP-dependent DNA helicase RecQ [Clostridia bacterium]|nr:ATP-dependent DNA helicase RecQ [Clostridia bacterium]
MEKSAGGERMAEDMMLRARKILRDTFGYGTFREGQEELVQAQLEGRDVLGIMPTGAGKSVCYQVPSLLMDGITLVISPLLSLMKDQVMNLKGAGVPAAFLNSSLNARQMELALSRAGEGWYRIIYVSPERLMTQAFRDMVLRQKISMVAVDEAHCVSHWGHEFRPDYLKIRDFLMWLPQRPVVSAFTATATREVRDDIVRILGLRDPVLVTTGFDRENLFFEVLEPVSPELALLQILRHFPEESGIVYCLSRAAVEEVAEYLKGQGIRAMPYHAGLELRDRLRAQDAFQMDECRVIVATNAFGMGIDKSNVRFVIHYNMPLSLEAYYQEAGRAGRDGGDAVCVVLFQRSDIKTARWLVSHASDMKEIPLSEEEREQAQNRDQERVYRMADYCEADTCYRREILRYFGDRYRRKCTGCALCVGTRFPEVEERYGARVNPYRKKVPPLPEEKPIRLTEMQEQEKRVQPKDMKEVPLWRRSGPGSLYSELLALRKKLAMESGQMPYNICSDVTLWRIEGALPQDVDELEDIQGLGVVKTERYGQQIVDTVRAWLDRHPEYRPEEKPPTKLDQEIGKMYLQGTPMRLMLEKAGSPKHLARSLRKLELISSQHARVIRGLAPDHNEDPWREEELHRLEELNDQGMSVSEMARELGRTPSSLLSLLHGK